MIFGFGEDQSSIVLNISSFSCCIRRHMMIIWDKNLNVIVLYKHEFNCWQYPLNFSSLIHFSASVVAVDFVDVNERLFFEVQFHPREQEAGGRS